MNHQRITLITLGVFLMAAAAGSRVYFHGVGGWIAPLMGPLLLDSYFRTNTFTFVVLTWGALFLVAAIVWVECKSLLTYSYVTVVLLLVVVGEYIGYRFAHGE
ncbi:MAG TPA: hypothetical protein VGO11_24005 [Chthoniobacteraceae bacterium]|jgi:hypothetical protein|nr:hypothetical protein [Chthoniobacteraceae bacterium]